MKIRLQKSVLGAGLAATLALSALMHSTATAAPVFEVDRYWPQEMPEDWLLGQVAGLSIDSRDHVWIVHRQGSINDTNAGAVQDPPVAMCCTPAPPVLELDTEGSVVNAWGGESDEYDWPQQMHGIYVDHNDYVWLGGNGPDDHQILKFTMDGEFVMQIGARGANQGSHDTENVGGPANMFVHAETNELYVADGYQNRRIVVFDAETGDYLRHWGAYGEEPVDVDPGPYDPTEGVSDTFRTPVHGVVISHDDILYMSDRPNNRVQMFQLDGTYIDEVVVRPETLATGSTWEIALSHDPQQRWLYVPDGTNNVIWILERETMEIVNHFGRGGRQPGHFSWLHNLDVDSQGNLYTAEVLDGHRIQRFLLQD